MQSLTVPTTISALAAAIAENLSDDDLALAAAILTQLGDTLATIAALRARSGNA
ncbi:MAG: hypothetical protein KHW93_00425 [Butyricicoccus pullicaecorum]|nr:hypothetical protein [Butyricicoccus pullicaecorum]